MRRRCGIQAEGVSQALQTSHPLHHLRAFGGNRAENLQECAGVHRVGGLHLEGIGTIGNIGHGHHALVPHMVHGRLQGRHFVFVGGSVPELVDLVDKTCHAGAPAEKAPHIGEFHMAVGVHKTRADDAAVHFFLLRTPPHPQDGSILLHLYKGVTDGVTGKGVDIFCGKALHRESTGGNNSVSRSCILMESTVCKYTLSFSKRT